MRTFIQPLLYYNTNTVQTYRLSSFIIHSLTFHSCVRSHIGKIEDQLSIIIFVIAPSLETRND